MFPPRRHFSMVIVLLLYPVVCLAGGIPEPLDSKVHVLSYDNYYRFIERHPLVLMEFYAPWCKHCQELAPHYREAAKQLSALDLPTPVVLAKYDDGDEYNRRLRAGAPEMYNYSAYPALLVFQDGEHEFYRGGREPEDIVMYMSALAKGLDPQKEEEKRRPGLYKKEKDYDPAFMIDLEPETFDDIVLSKNRKNNVLWIVEFYSDRCPFCKSLAPEMVKAAHAIKKKFPNEIRFGGVNSRIFHEIAERFEVTGWPWVSSFYMGEKVEDMAGLGGAESVINWATQKKNEVWKEGNGDDTSPYNDGIGGSEGCGAEESESCASEENNVGENVFGKDKTETGKDVGTNAAVKPPKLGDVDLEHMIEVALKYNIMQLKSVQKMRRAIRLQKITEDKAAAKVFKKVQPLLTLLREAGKI